MKSIIAILFSVLMPTAFMAQSHLDFEYRIDSKVFSGDEQLTFSIYEYPHFNSFASEEAEARLTDIFNPKEELRDLEPRNEEVELVTELYGIKPNDVLSPEDLFEMMKNRVGLMKTKMRDTNIIVRVLIDKITYPDHRVGDFNLERISSVWGSQARDHYERTSYEALSWRTGEVYTISDFAGDKALKCIKEASQAIDAPCGEKDLKTRWLESLDCDLAISRKFSDYWEFEVDPRAFGCHDSKQKLIRIKVETSCFEGDEPCK